MTGWKAKGRLPGSFLQDLSTVQICRSAKFTLLKLPAQVLQDVRNYFIVIVTRQNFVF